MPRYPPLTELVMVTVKRVLPYGAIVAMDEYDGLEAFVHISEVSTGWTRNVSEHLKEGQKAVVKVMRLDPEKRQVDASLKRVSEGERRQKAEAYKAEKRAQKLLERAAFKAKSTPQAALAEAGVPLVAEYGSLHAAFESIAAGEIPQAKIDKKWMDVLSEVAKAEIKKKEVEVKASLNLVFYGSGGLKRLMDALAGVEKASGVQVHYVGAGHYSLKSVAGDYKSAEKALDKVEAFLEAGVSGSQAEYSVERKKK